MEVKEKSRLLGRNIGRAITADESEMVGGGSCCWANTVQATSFTVEDQSYPDSYPITYDYTCYYA